MNIKIGSDILKRSRFLDSHTHGGLAFLEKIFTPQEIRVNTIDQLASIFCVKEAVIKALELPHQSWLSINAQRKSNGKVFCSFTNPTIARRVATLDTSISHEEEMIIAVAVAILQNE